MYFIYFWLFINFFFLTSAGEDKPAQLSLAGHHPHTDTTIGDNPSWIPEHSVTCLPFSSS
jgi:hypothetical protein